MFHDISLSVMLVVIDHDNIISALVLPTALIDWKTAIGTLFMIMACCVCAWLIWSPKHDNYHRHYRQFRWRIIFDWAQKTSIMKIESSNIWHIVYNIAHSLQFYSLILILRSHKFTHCKINHFLQCFVGKLCFFAVYHLLFIISTYISTLLVAIRFTW